MATVDTLVEKFRQDIKQLKEKLAEDITALVKASPEFGIDKPKRKYTKAKTPVVAKSPKAKPAKKAAPKKSTAPSGKRRGRPPGSKNKKTVEAIAPVSSAETLQ